MHLIHCQSVRRGFVPSSSVLTNIAPLGQRETKQRTARLEALARERSSPLSAGRSARRTDSSLRLSNGYRRICENRDSRWKQPRERRRVYRDDFVATQEEPTTRRTCRWKFFRLYLDLIFRCEDPPAGTRRATAQGRRCTDAAARGGLRCFARFALLHRSFHRVSHGTVAHSGTALTADHRLLGAVTQRSYNE